MISKYRIKQWPKVNKVWLEGIKVWAKLITAWEEVIKEWEEVITCGKRLLPYWQVNIFFPNEIEGIRN